MVLLFSMKAFKLMLKVYKFTHFILLNRIFVIQFKLKSITTLENSTQSFKNNRFLFLHKKLEPKFVMQALRY